MFSNVWTKYARPLARPVDTRGHFTTSVFCAVVETFVNSLWPNNAILRHGLGSTLAQVMAWCLTAPSHYLNQCWLVIRKIQLHSCDGNFTSDTSVMNDYINMKITHLKCHQNPPGSNKLIEYLHYATVPRKKKEYYRDSPYPPKTYQ